MTDMKNVLSQDSLSSLAKLRDATLEFIAGRALWNHETHMHGDNVIFVTDGAMITVWGDTEDWQFEGFDETYSILRVTSGDMGLLNDARDEGNVYVQHSGERITGISIARETITEERDGQIAWTYVTDVAVVMDLETVRLCIAKDSHHDELLKVVFSSLSSALTVPEAIGGWRPELGVEYRRSTDVLPLDGLLDGRVCHRHPTPPGGFEAHTLRNLGPLVSWHSQISPGVALSTPQL